MIPHGITAKTFQSWPNTYLPMTPTSSPATAPPNTAMTKRTEN
jgi:hypothetical protein